MELRRSGAPAAPSAHFKVLGVLGEGAQGTVYRVRSKGATKDCALKFIDPRIVSQGGWAGHEISQIFQHPNIVAVLATGVFQGDPAGAPPRPVAGTPVNPSASIEAPWESLGALPSPSRPDLSGPYVVYEIVDGETLEEVLKPEGLPLDVAIRIGFDILAGLSRCHAARVVHCDLKPSNILMTRDGVAKIADFGLGRFATESAPSGTHPFLGTPLYAAPEQIEGTGLFPATDIYAFGCLFYELLAGCRWVNPGNLVDLFRQHLTVDPTPPGQVRPEIGKALDAFVLQCLAKDPARRFPDARAAFEALTRVARSQKLPHPLRLEERDPTPPGQVAGMLRVLPRLVAGGLLLGSAYTCAGTFLGFPDLVPWSSEIYTIWLLLAGGASALLEIHPEIRSASNAGIGAGGTSRWEIRLGRWVLGLFFVAIALAVWNNIPTSIADFAGMGLLVLTFSLLLWAVPGLLLWIEEPLEAEPPPSRPRVRFEGPAGLRLSVNDSAAQTVPFECDLTPGGHEVHVEGAGSYFLRVADQAGLFTANLASAYATGKTRVPSESQPQPDSSPGPLGLVLATLLCGPLLAVGVALVGFMLVPGERREGLVWRGALPEPPASPKLPPEPREPEDNVPLPGTNPAFGESYSHMMSVGNRMMNDKRYKDARECYQLAYNGRQTGRSALGLAESEFRMGNEKEARHWLKKVPMEELSNPHLVGKVNPIMKSAGAGDALVDVYRQALKEASEYDEIRLELVILLAELGRDDEAHSEFVSVPPSAARVEKLLMRCTEPKTPIQWAVGCVHRVLRDPALRTKEMGQTVYRMANYFASIKDHPPACALIAALRDSGLRHESLRRARKDWCR